MKEPSIDLELSLKYHHAWGALAPYFEALGRGEALANRCSTCGSTYFPPRLTCCTSTSSKSQKSKRRKSSKSKANTTIEWVTLSGRGVISAWTSNGDSSSQDVLPLTETPAGEGLALIAMEGASNLALGWVDGDAGKLELGAEVELVARDESVSHPAQAACFRLVSDD